MNKFFQMIEDVKLVYAKYIKVYKVDLFILHVLL